MLLDAMCMDCAILLLMIVCSINGRNTITKRLQLPLNLQPSIKPETNNLFPTGEALSRTRRRGAMFKTKGTRSMYVIFRDIV